MAGVANEIFEIQFSSLNGNFDLGCNYAASLLTGYQPCGRSMCDH
jgi:hypothetical protein